jgi:DUF3040 family protein
MLNERDDRVLRDLEHWTNIEDPAFARRLGRADPWARWRSAWRHGTRVPSRWSSQPSPWRLSRCT